MRLSGRTAALAALASVTLLIAGCSDSDDGGDSAAPTSAAAPVPISEDAVPGMRNPRDVAGFMDRVCDLLTPGQLAELGIADPTGRSRQVVPEVGDLANTQECRWGNSAQPVTLRAAIDPDHDLLSGTIDAYSGDPVFERIQVGGLPAVLHQPYLGSPGCTVVVGIADTQGMNVGYTDNHEPIEDPCGHAERAAAAVVSNLPPLR